MSRRLIELMKVFSKPIVTVSTSSNNVQLEDIEKELRNVKSENQDLVNAYEMTQQELDELRDKARDIEIESVKRSIVDLFKLMNSSENGNLLDIIAQTERHIRLLKSDGWEPTEKEEGLILTIRMIYKFLKKYGVSPMDEIGTKLCVNLRQSELYDYAGSEFKDEKEIKNVEIKAPGWSYQKDIISRPKIQESF